MAETKKRTFRLSDEDWERLQNQAAKLNLDATAYIRLLIELEASADIVSTLKELKALR